MEIEYMAYRKYKQSYADCETVPGSYDKTSKMIKVIIPDGRKKKSGVRGQRFNEYKLYFGNGDKKEFNYYRATCLENAFKQHEKWCKEKKLHSIWGRVIRNGSLFF